MKYREKLLREHPECVDDIYIGGCKYCPGKYGYEEMRKNCPQERDIDARCRKCWDREMEGAE